MSRIRVRRLVLVGICAVSTALAAAAPGSAAINPTLSVGVSGQSRESTVTVDVRVGQSDDWVGRLQLFIPTGFKPSTPAGGAALGSGRVTAIGTLVGPDQIFAMDAKVTPVGTTDPAVSSQTTSCDNVSHLAAWLVQAQGGDDSWSFPIFVDQTSGGETAFGSYKLVACFGPRESGSTNSESNKLMGFSLSFQGFTLPAKAGDYKWRGLLTPFGGDQSNQSGNTSTSALNQAGSVEAQSTTTIAPGALTIAARPLRSGRVVITGRLSLAGKPVRGATVAIHHGLSPAKLVSLGTAKTNAAGVFTKTVRIKGASYFQAGATAAKQNLGAGGCTASFGLPCLDATIGGTAVVSKTIHVT